MVDILITWLNTEVDLSKKITNMEQDFANGYLLGELLYKFNQLTNISDYKDKNNRKIIISNFGLLYDVFRRIKIQLTPELAEDIIKCVRGKIPMLLYKIRSKLEKKGVNQDNFSFKKSDHLTSMYSSMKFTKEIPAYDNFNKDFFTQQLQKRLKAQSRILEDKHLAKYEIIGLKNDHKIKSIKEEEEIIKQIQAEEKIKQMQGELARFHTFQQQFEQRGIDDWKKNMLKNKERERKDLDFQLRQAEKYQKAVQNVIRNGEMTVKTNIEKFEKNTLKNINEDLLNTSDETAQSVVSPKGYKKAWDFSDNIRDNIMQKIMNNQAAQTERSRRRRKIIVEQSKAQFEIENRRKEEQYIQKLFKQSNQERQLHYETHRTVQIKNVIIENRNLRDWMYGERNDMDVKDLEANETDFLRFHCEYFQMDLEREDTRRKDLEIALNQKKRSNNTEHCKRMADLIFDIAQEAFAYQQVNDCEDVDTRVWREWTQLFISNQSVLNRSPFEIYEDSDKNESIVDNVLSPMVSYYNTKYCETYYSAYTSDNTYTSFDKILDECEFMDYVNFLGQWSNDMIPDSAFVTLNLQDLLIDNANATSVNDKTKKNVQPNKTDEYYKEEDMENLIIPSYCYQNTLLGDIIDNLIDIKYGEEEKTRRNFIFSHIPIKLAIIGHDFAGKKTQAKILSENFPLKIYNLEEILEKAFSILTRFEQPLDLNKTEFKNMRGSLLEEVTKERDIEEKKYSKINSLARRMRDMLKKGEAVSDDIYVDLLTEFILIDFPCMNEEDLRKETLDRVRDKAEIREKLAKNDLEKEKRPIAAKEIEEELTEELDRIKLVESRGFLIVNFPNTMNQARILEQRISTYTPDNEKPLSQAVLLKEKFALILDKSAPFTQESKLIRGGLDYIFLLEVPPRECIRRAVGRRVVMKSHYTDSYQTIRDKRIKKVYDETVYHLHDRLPSVAEDMCERLDKVDSKTNSESTLVNRHLSFENTVNSIAEFYHPFGFELQKVKMFNCLMGKRDKDSVSHDLIDYLNKLIDINEKRDNLLAEQDENSDLINDSNSIDISNRIDTEEAEEFAKTKTKLEKLKSVLNKDLCEILVKLWSRLFSNYMRECKSVFKFIRLQRDSIGVNFNLISQKFIDFLKRPSKKQIILLDFQMKYNKFMDDYPDLIDDPQVKEEHHQEVDDMNDKIYELIEIRKNEAIEERRKIMTSGWIENEMEKFYLHLERLYQSEVDKFLGSLQIIKDYYHNLDNRPLVDLPFNTIELIKDEIDPTLLENENDPNSFPRVDRLYKNALKAQFQYDEALLSAEKKRLEKLTDANKKNTNKQKDNKKPTEIENNKKDVFQNEEEMLVAVKNEKAKYRYRTTLLKYWGIFCLKNMRNIANIIYSKLEDWIILSNKCENEALEQLTMILKSHIEKEKKIKYELELDTFDIVINRDVQNFIELPPKRHPAKEIINHHKFNINQLNILIEELKMYEISPNTLRTSTFVEIMIKKFVSSKNNTDVYYGIPNLLKNLSFHHYYRFIKHLDPNHTDSVSLRHIGTYFCIMNSLLCTAKHEKAFREAFDFEEGDTKKVTVEEFVSAPMWFDSYEESTTLPMHESFGRVIKLKEIIFNLNKDQDDLIDLKEVLSIFNLKALSIDSEQNGNKSYYELLFF